MTQLTRTELIAEIARLIDTAGDPKISAADLRSVLADVFDSAAGFPPTLAHVVTALGLAAVASANRGDGIRRKTDETGFEYFEVVESTGGVTKIRAMTQSAFDSLATKDGDTLYITT
ncbi:MAG: hypothetical protein OXG72_14335 [Acidobacteria bacterium]|nr:hypothetical protein [Acidobacteriota bacterium]